MVELLVVIVILAILIALLLPAINSAVRSARNATVSTEISQLSTALANFKSKYGEFPPSRVLLSETGFYPVNLTAAGNAIAPGDITLGQLAQRSLNALRKYFPNVYLSTIGTGDPNLLFNQTGGKRWFDFNGNGVLDTNPYIIHGHECLVFFLGGIPLVDSSGSIGLTGFGKDPSNPFTNSVVGNSNYSGNRQPPMYEFAASRLALDPNSTSGMPAYLDALGNGSPTVGGTANFLVYFSAYGNGGYDPNDVNIPETDSNGAGPITLTFRVAFPVVNATNNRLAISPSPNPYTSTLTVPASGTSTYLNAQTYQIISSGLDGLYGVGGQYSANAAGTTLPLDTTSGVYGSSTDLQIRAREGDNLTNFSNGKLQQ